VGFKGPFQWRGLKPAHKKSLRKSAFSQGLKALLPRLKAGASTVLVQFAEFSLSLFSPSEFLLFLIGDSYLRLVETRNMKFETASCRIISSRNI